MQAEFQRWIDRLTKDQLLEAGALQPADVFDNRLDPFVVAAR